MAEETNGYSKDKSLIEFRLKDDHERLEKIFVELTELKIKVERLDIRTGFIALLISGAVAFLTGYFK